MRSALRILPFPPHPQAGTRGRGERARRRLRFDVVELALACATMRRACRIGACRCSVRTAGKGAARCAFGRGTSGPAHPRKTTNPYERRDYASATERIDIRFYLARIIHRSTLTRSASEEEQRTYLACASGWCSRTLHANREGR